MMFYKETDFHESPIGKIPKKWEAKATEDLFTIETGTTPSTAQETYWKNGTVNWLTPTDLSKVNGKLRIKGSERRITEKALKETNLTLMPKGSIILSTRAPVGYVATLEEEATFNQGCKGLIPRRSNELFPEFYTYYLSNKQKVLQNLSCGSTFLELSKNRLEKFSMPFFPIPEQRAIVGVLGVVDSALEYADQIIAKCERLKRGLMQQLLTHGIGHTEYKQTPIGKLPEEWETAELAKVSQEVIIGNVNPATPFYTTAEKGIPYFRSQNVRENNLTPTTTYVKGEFNQIHPKSVLRENDVLTVQTGFIGTSCLVPKRYEGSNCHSLLITRTKPQELSPQFLCYFLNSDVGKKDIMKHNAGWGRAHLLLEDFRKAEIPIPPLAEQLKIADILSTAYKKIALERSEKTKLEQIKAGLMDLLLTGKVRIKVD